MITTSNGPGPGEDKENLLMGGKTRGKKASKPVEIVSGIVTAHASATPLSTEELVKEIADVGAVVEKIDFLKDPQAPKSPRKRGAPILPENAKRSSTYSLRLWHTEHDRYETYCRQRGIKLAEFYRSAIRDFLGKNQRISAEEKEYEGHDKVYILHMMAEEKRACEAFVSRHGNVTLRTVIRTAAETYYQENTSPRK